MYSYYLYSNIKEGVLLSDNTVDLQVLQKNLTVFSLFKLNSIYNMLSQGSRLYNHSNNYIIYKKYNTMYYVIVLCCNMNICTELYINGV